MHLPQEFGLITIYFTYVCSSKARDIFIGILYGYKMILQIIALVFAFSIHKVKVKGLDDAKYIAVAIYVTSIVFAVIIVSAYTLKEFTNLFPALFCTGFFIGTTSILGLVFVPKVCVRPMTSVTMLGFLSLAIFQLLDRLTRQTRHVCLLKPHSHTSTIL